MKKNEAVISANKFLDLLSCVVPAMSDNLDRPEINCVQLELIENNYSIRAVATDGAVLSVATRDLGFSTENQLDLEDLQAKKLVKNAIWHISKIDAELLIISLKKLGVKRLCEDSENKQYVVISEFFLKDHFDENGEIFDKNLLRIELLGSSHVVLEPKLLNVDFPFWKNLIPIEETSINYILFDLKKLNLLNKCWGQEKIIMSFFSKDEITKITRNSFENQTSQDFIILMPMRKNEEQDKEIINKNQLNLF